MSIFMITHDIKESFQLGTRLLVFDKVRHDPQAPDAYGARITYDLRLKAHSERAALAAVAAEALSA
jgi:NitT/TauT family transport system ATP-binding protein